VKNWQKKVQPGDPVRNSAAAYNAFIDAAVAHRNLTVTGVTKVASRAGDYVLAENRGTEVAEAWYPVLLDTGVEEAVVRRDARMVLAFGDPAAGLAAYHAAACVGVPQEPIRPGAVGVVCVSGMTYAVCRIGGDYVLRPGQRLGYATDVDLGTGDVTRCFGRHSYGNAIAYGPAKAIDADFEVRPVRLTAGNHAFAAKIGIATQISNSAKWEYDWEEVAFFENLEWVVPADGMTSAVDGKALNSLETANTNNTAYGGPVTGSQFQINETGVLFRPVPSGVVVQMWFEADPATGRGLPIFQAPNAIYGPCTLLDGGT
jgi:hypothetical protein